MAAASNFNFTAGEDGAVLLYVDANDFIEQCMSHQGHYAFFFERALARR